MDRIKSVNRVFLVTVIISILGQFLNDFVSRFTDNYLILLLISQLILVIPSLAYLIIHKVNVGKAIRLKKIRLSNVILIIVFAYLISPLMNFINAVSLLFVKNDISNIMFNIVDHNSLLLSFLMVALVPCILEESVYRGILYNEYRKVNPLKGILLSGFLFGIMHGNFNQFSYAFAMGIIFALLIEASDSILATMIVHFVINGTSVLTMGLYPKLATLLEQFYGKDKYNAKELIAAMKDGASQGLDASYIMLYGLGALIPTILAFIVFRNIAKNEGRWEYVKGIFRKNSDINTSTHPSPTITEEILYNNSEDIVRNNGRRILTVSLAFGIAICLGLMVINEFAISDIPEQSLNSVTTSAIYLWKQWF